MTAAAVAAVSLHVLLFILLISPSQKVNVATYQGALQIELLARKTQIFPHKTVIQPVKSMAQQNTEEPMKQPLLPKAVAAQPVPPVLEVIQPVQQSVSQAVQQVQQTALDAPIQKAIATPALETAQSKKEPTTIAHKQPEKSSHKRGASVVPQHVQRQILAEVHYPRQARRRGWQGSAEIQFDVHQQSIQAVRLLASTGYPILDRAAQRGLSAVQHISLSNGLYRMPIVFRLQ